MDKKLKYCVSMTCKGINIMLLNHFNRLKSRMTKVSIINIKEEMRNEDLN